jgi:LAO/AO transport system kinase
MLTAVASPRSTDPGELIQQARAGDRAALARLISIIERGGPEARAVSRVTHPLSGHSYTIGITGAPGAGKSTLTSALVSVVREGGDEVGVLAIDPSSPFTGGAILGDRVRMGDHALDQGVFIRSMATRGHLGGLALATPEAMRVLDAAGLPWVIIETVGVGQVEVEITGSADTTIVVVNPGWGDAVQANKAGLMEIADVFVINKADRPGAEETRRDLEQMLELGYGGADPSRWRPPVLSTVAAKGEGAAELWAGIQHHRQHLLDADLLAPRRVARTTDELQRIVAAQLLERARAVAAGDRFEALRDEVLERTIDPWTAAARLLDDIGT